MIEHLRKLAPEVVERYLETRNAESLGIPDKLAEYILQLNEASNLHRRIHSITECAARLQKSYPNLSIATCKSRIYDSINYLHSDCSVTAQAWNNFYADQMMLLMEVNLAAHELKEARVCMEKARAYRIDASANSINPDLLKFKHQIVSPDFELERMGVKKQGLLAAYNKAVALINKRDIPAGEKKRLTAEVENELNIKTINYEEIPG